MSTPFKHTNIQITCSNTHHLHPRDAMTTSCARGSLDVPAPLDTLQHRAWVESCPARTWFRPERTPSKLTHEHRRDPGKIEILSKRSPGDPPTNRFSEHTVNHRTLHLNPFEALSPLAFRRRPSKIGSRRFCIIFIKTGLQHHRFSLHSRRPSPRAFMRSNFPPIFSCQLTHNHRVLSPCMWRYGRTVRYTWITRWCWVDRGHVYERTA